MWHDKGMSKHSHTPPAPRTQRAQGTSLFAQTWIFIAIGALLGAVVAAGVFATQTHRWVDARWPGDNTPDNAVNFMSTLGMTISSDDFTDYSDDVCASMDEFVPKDASSAATVWVDLAQQHADTLFNKDSFSMEGDADNPTIRDVSSRVAVEAAITYSCPQYLPDMYAYSQDNIQ